jgi:hypothetical protein
LSFSVVVVLKPSENVPEPSYVANVVTLLSIDGPAVKFPELKGPDAKVAVGLPATPRGWVSVVNVLINGSVAKLNPGNGVLRLKLVCVVPAALSAVFGLVFVRVIEPFIAPVTEIWTLVSSPLEGLNWEHVIVAFDRSVLWAILEQVALWVAAMAKLDAASKNITIPAKRTIDSGVERFAIM